MNLHMNLRKKGNRNLESRTKPLKLKLGNVALIDHNRTMQLGLGMHRISCFKFVESMKMWVEYGQAPRNQVKKNRCFSNML